MEKEQEIDSWLSKRLRAARLGVGLSQEDASRHLGIKFQQLQKFELGTNRIRAAQLAVLAHAYHRPIPWFFGDYASAVVDRDILGEFFSLPYSHEIAQLLIRRPAIMKAVADFVEAIEKERSSRD